MRFYIFIWIAILCASCTEPVTEQTVEQTPISTQEIIADIPIINNRYDVWEDFWHAFQTAIKNQDKDKVKALSIFGVNWSDHTFEEQYELYIDANMRQIITSTAATAVPISDILELSDAINIREIAFSESSIEEGIEYESALILYFGKINNRYGLIMWMAAG